MSNDLDQVHRVATAANVHGARCAGPEMANFLMALGEARRALALVPEWGPPSNPANRKRSSTQPQARA